LIEKSILYTRRYGVSDPTIMDEKKIIKKNPSAENTFLAEDDISGFFPADSEPPTM
jgi:hypothetical protein